jgi:type I site-specific restriction endonuclease
MTPEIKARQQIDQKLEQAGWIVQDMKQLNLGAAQGFAVREYPTDTGPADYVLFVNRQAVGVIEAKRDEAAENITTVDNQTARYAHAKLKWRKDDTPLPFLFESTGQIIRFTDERDPAPRSRELFHFFTPEQLIDWLAQPNTLRGRLYQQMPELPINNLRECQINAVTGLEQSLANNKPRALVHMASHADDIINMVREVYGQSNAFCKKVTYKADEDPDSILSSFRNDYNPRIAVTVDMIATGSDVKPLEVLLFMRDVRSKGYYEQMKGRGVRSLGYDDLKRVSNSADSAKTRFVLIDAVGVEKSLKTESRPLEKKPDVALKDLLQGIAIGHRDDDTVLSLANRLIRLDKQLDAKAHARITQAAGGIPVSQLAKNLIAAVDPDQIIATALATAQAQGITRSEDTLTAAEIEAARNQRVAVACAAFDNPELREHIESARREREQLIDHLNLDQTVFVGYSEQAQAQAEKVIQSFADYIQQHKDEIAALSLSAAAGLFATACGENGPRRNIATDCGENCS